MKRILVTGGAGFIGSHLCERLLASGHEVICVDDFSTGRMQNIASFSRYGAHWRWESRDVCYSLVPNYYRKIDQVYHLACPASPIHYRRDPVKTARTCAIGTLNALELARRDGSRFLLASTSEVYGEPLEHPQTESYRGNVSTTGPRACYDEGKRFAETLAADYRRQHGVDAKIARIFNTYGPRMASGDGRVVPEFITAALRGAPILLNGQGRQTRSFCYVEDTVAGLVALMESDESGPINIGRDVEVSVRALSERVIEMTRSSSALELAPMPKDDPTRRRPDISLAHARLGWTPKVSMEDGLALTIDYFRNLMKEAA